MELLEIKVETDGGPWAKHNYPCPVYQKFHAVIDLNTGIFHPSWAAQKDGWHLIDANTWLKRTLYKLFFEAR